MSKIQEVATAVERGKSKKVAGLVQEALDSGATAPLATATPAFRASEREAPEMVVEISEVLRIRVFGCDSASGSEACVRAIGSGRSGRSILSVTCTSLRTLSAIRGFGAGRSLDFRKEGFLLEESLRPIPSFR